MTKMSNSIICLFFFLVRKVCQLQQELSEARTIGHTVTDENNQKEVDANLQAELDAQRRDLEVEHHRKMTSQREEMVRISPYPFFSITICMT